MPSIGRETSEGISARKGQYPANLSEQPLRGKGKFKLPRKWQTISPKEDKPGQAVWGGGVGGSRLGKQLGAPTAFGLEVGNAVHDDVVEEEGLVVHLDAAREEPTEVMDVPGGQTGSSGELSSHRGTPTLDPCIQPPYGEKPSLHRCARTHLFWDGCPTGTTLSS